MACSARGSNNQLASQIKVMWVATGRDASTRWCGGTGDQARARRKCLGRGASLECEGLPWDRKRRDLTTRASVPRTPLLAGGSLPTGPRAGGGGGEGGVPSQPATGVHQKERRDSGVRPNCGMSRLSCNRHRITEQSLATANAGHGGKCNA